MLVRGQWFCPGTPASSTTKTGLHDIAEILLKVALNSKNQNQSYLHYLCLLGNSVVQHILCCVFALFIFVYVDSFFGFSIVSLISRCNYLTDDTDVALTKLRETYSYWYVLKWTSDLSRIRCQIINFCNKPHQQQCIQNTFIIMAVRLFGGWHQCTMRT